MKWVKRRGGVPASIGRVVATVEAGHVAVVAWEGESVSEVPACTLEPFADLIAAPEFERRYRELYAERFGGAA